MANKSNGKFLILILLWTSVIFYVLLRPADDLQSIMHLHFPGLDKIVHAALFGIWTLITVWGKSKNSWKLQYWQIVIIGAVLAGITELLQIPVKDRTADFLDFVADVFGILLTFFIMRKWLIPDE